MDFSLAVKNIIIVGDFNPAFFDKYFFIKNNIVQETDIDDSCHFLTDVCILNTTKFNLTIVSNQLVLSDLNSVYDINKAIEIVNKITASSQFKSTALGINFHWYLFSEEKTSEISKKYFYNENEMLTKQFFNGDNTSYGIYLSKDFGLSRMKLDIKPATLTKIDTNNEQRVIAFVFNFHVDLKNDNKDKIFAALEEAQKYCEESKKIINAYEFK